jgi:hypothetical protein
MKEDVNRAIEVFAVQLFLDQIKNGILIAAKNAMIWISELEKFARRISHDL